MLHSLYYNYSVRHDVDWYILIEGPEGGGGGGGGGRSPVPFLPCRTLLIPNGQLVYYLQTVAAYIYIKVTSVKATKCALDKHNKMV